MKPDLDDEAEIGQYICTYEGTDTRILRLFESSPTIP